MKRLCLALVVLTTVSANAQQWTGSTDLNNEINRNGNIRANNLTFGRYGSTFLNDSNPYNIFSTDPGENHDLLIFGNSTSILNMRLYDGDLKFGTSAIPNTLLSNNGNAWFMGSIGIGTSSPTSALHINTASSILQVQSSGAANSATLNLINDSGNAGLSLSSYGSTYSGGTYNRANGVSLHTTTTNAASAGIGIAARHASGYITFHTGGNTERLRIAADGKVGIGSSAPLTKLDLGELRFDAISAFPAEGSVLEGTWGNYVIGDVTSSQRLRLGVANDGYTRAEIFLDNSNRQDGKIEFKTAAVSGGVSTRMVVDGAGKVGIGTSSPQTALEVNGDISVGSDLAPISGYGTRLNMLGASSNGDALWMARYNNGANQSELRVNIGDDYGQTQDMFVVGTHHWNGGTWMPHLAVQASGNVGIGTTSTGSFKLAVEGKIGAREVNVTATNPWPDYVFKDNYQLRPLSEVQQFISENHHLPEVPSEKEVIANGQNLGEMNAILLKKIEELTLYVLELKRENELQQKALDKLISDKHEE